MDSKVSSVLTGARSASTRSTNSARSARSATPSTRPNSARSRPRSATYYGRLAQENRVLLAQCYGRSLPGNVVLARATAFHVTE